VQGPVKFRFNGENPAGKAFIFQWQPNGQFLPVLGPQKQARIQAQKPHWQT
jgi:hypothetical protein